jgi:hypothetical protein
MYMPSNRRTDVYDISLLEISMNRRGEEASPVVLHVEQLDLLQVNRNVEPEPVRTLDLVAKNGLEHRPQVGRVAAEGTRDKKCVNQGPML